MVGGAGVLFADAVSTVPDPAMHFRVISYDVEGDPLLSSNSLAAVFNKHAGTNVTVNEIVDAASDLENEYNNEGYPQVGIAFNRGQIADGVVIFHVFQAAVPQVLVSGVRYETFTNNIASALGMPATNAAPVAEEISKRDANGRVHVIPSKKGRRFAVSRYQVLGNSLLTPDVIAGTLTNIDGAYGTNVSLEGIRTVISELQGAYRDRGYFTVSVGLPQQKLTNATVTIKVIEGQLANIRVTGNRYYSSNNIMRALPSLDPGMILNANILQAELNRANANQDRQIYPVVEPGPDPGTSDLELKVKDQLPLHAKIDLDNASSPDTPLLRVNSSAVYNNLWQDDNAVGVQYSFSPEQYKQDSQWAFYDQPLVANYSAFYRIPLGNPQSVADIIASKPGTFGYSEATRKFNVPPPTGVPELTVFASRSTIDTSLENLSTQNIFSSSNETVALQNVQQDLTVNNDIGARLNDPHVTPNNTQYNFGAGVDFKTYQVQSSKTNLFTSTQIIPPAGGGAGVSQTIVSTDSSQVPTTVKQMQYLPVSLHVDGTWHDALGTTTLALGAGYNPWFDSQTYTYQNVTLSNTSPEFPHGIPTNITTIASGKKSVQGITGSPESTGHWVVLTPSLTRTFNFHTNWVMTIRADGQWANEPLISNEQYGAGGVNSVRGYREGEVFGDTGWHVTVEQQTPPHVVGIVYGKTPLTIRGTVYMDYARVYLIDPQGQKGATSLWGAGLGGVASIGPHWEARALFSVPLLSTETTEAYIPFFNFSLTAQF